MKIFLSFIIVLFSILNAQLPVSKQATIIETISSSEVMVEATGIYKGKGKKKKHKIKDVKSKGVPQAVLDAKKSAVWFILFGGTDPLLKSTQEQQVFSQHENFFFNNDNISNYITYEDIQLIKKLKTDDGQGLKVVKRFKVNKELLTRDLEARNIIAARADLAATIGNPFIMVLPAVKKGESPIDALRTNPAYKHASAVVESYLTSRQYDVIIPEQQESLENLNASQMDIGDREEDYAYQLALSIGSDIYIEFSGTQERADYGTKKYVLTVRAYETTTARLLGSETGYSQGRKGELMVSVEEAMNDAIDKVLARVTEYWKKDVDKGIQYKLIFNLSTDFDEDEVEEIQFALMDAIEEMSNSSKENIVTNQTIDYLIWCDPGKYDKSSKVYRYVKKYFKKEETSGTLRKVNVNRKMILLKVDYE
tara:strand:- start:207 stop:1475 length:1269 start_codon:yes stop_codon:yes gene_type:complete